MTLFVGADKRQYIVVSEVLQPVKAKARHGKYKCGDIYRLQNYSYNKVVTLFSVTQGSSRNTTPHTDLKEAT